MVTIVQLVEHQFVALGVAGSIPVGYPIRGVRLMVRTPGFHPGNRGSIPLRPTKIIYGPIAQLGEHLPYKQGVTGSSPVGTTINGGVAQFG